MIPSDINNSTSVQIQPNSNSLVYCDDSIVGNQRFIENNLNSSLIQRNTVNNVGNMSQVCFKFSSNEIYNYIHELRRLKTLPVSEFKQSTWKSLLDKTKVFRKYTTYAVGLSPDCIIPFNQETYFEFIMLGNQAIMQMTGIVNDNFLLISLVQTKETYVFAQTLVDLAFSSTAECRINENTLTMIRNGIIRNFLFMGKNLAKHPIANRVIQNCCSNFTIDFLIIYTKSLLGSYKELAEDNNGNYVVQKLTSALTYKLYPDHIEENNNSINNININNETGKILAASDPNNQIAQTIYNNRITPEQTKMAQFLIEAIGNEILTGINFDMVNTVTGCRVVQKIAQVIPLSALPESCMRILYNVKDSTTGSQSLYGFTVGKWSNFFLQGLLQNIRISELDKKSLKDNLDHSIPTQIGSNGFFDNQRKEVYADRLSYFIYCNLVQNLISLSPALICDKFGSHVLETLIDVCGINRIWGLLARFYDTIVNLDNFSNLLTQEYANYVIQKMIKGPSNINVEDNPQRETLTLMVENKIKYILGNANSFTKKEAATIYNFCKKKNN